MAEDNNRTTGKRIRVGSVSGDSVCHLHTARYQFVLRGILVWVHYVCPGYTGVIGPGNRRMEKVKNIEEQKHLKIKDVLEKKYGFIFRPGIDSHVLIMDEDLTIGELIKKQNELKEQDCQIGVKITTAVKVLVRAKKMPAILFILIESLWIPLLIISIALFFVNWVYGVLSIILTIKEFIAPFFMKTLRAKIVKLALTDYESLYLLSATNSISVKD